MYLQWVAFQVFKSKGVAFEVFKFSGVAFRVFAVFFNNIANIIEYVLEITYLVGLYHASKYYVEVLH